jgi:hypothetical protein
MIVTILCLIFHLILIIVGVINPTIGFIAPTVIGVVIQALHQAIPSLVLNSLFIIIQFRIGFFKKDTGNSK